jgi:hypothetical protein
MTGPVTPIESKPTVAVQEKHSCNEQQGRQADSGKLPVAFGFQRLQASQGAAAKNQGQFPGRGRSQMHDENEQCRLYRQSRDPLPAPLRPQDKKQAMQCRHHAQYRQKAQGEHRLQLIVVEHRRHYKIMANEERPGNNLGKQRFRERYGEYGDRDEQENKI